MGAGSGGHVLELRDAGIAGAIGPDPFLKQDVVVDGETLVYRRTPKEMTGTLDLITFQHSLEHMAQQIEAPATPGGWRQGAVARTRGLICPVTKAARNKQRFLDKHGRDTLLPHVRDGNLAILGQYAEQATI